MPPLPRLSRRSLLGAGVGAGVGAGLLGPLAGCAAKRPDPPSPFRLATGPAGAVYREIGRAYADLLDDAWGRPAVEVLATEAAQQNARLLTSGAAEIGFVNVDVASEHPDSLRALARVFDSVVHLVVAEDSPVRRLADLEGRVLAAGLEESGTRYVLARLLELAGVEVELRSLSQADSVAALLEDEVDVVVSLTGMPTPAVTELAAAPRPTRLVDLTEDLARITAAHPLDYLPVVVPATMYPPMPAAATVAVPTLLTVPTATDDAVARFCVDVLFDRAAELSRVRPEASQINPRTGAATTPVALHPAAQRWFRDQKP